MKTATQRWVTFGLRTAMIGVLGLSVTGCGATSDSSPVSEGNQGDQDSADVVEPSKVTTSAGAGSGEGFCGSSVVGVDEDGRDLVVAEIYNYGAINNVLALRSDIQAAIGLTTVSDCAAARAFMRAQAELPSAEPVAPVVVPANLVADGPPEGREIPKMLGGVLGYKRDSVQISWQIPTNWPIPSGTAAKDDPRGKIASCSAVRVAGPLYLTAAHCLFPNGQTQIDMAVAWIKRRNSAGNATKYQGKCNKKKTDCNILHLVGAVHPGYLGSGDWGHDLALVYVLPSSQGKPSVANSLRADTAAWTTNYAGLATMTPAAGDQVRFWTWGPGTEGEAITKYTERTATTPVTVDSLAPQGINRHYAYIVKSQSNAHFCHGDSGSGSYPADHVIPADSVYSPINGIAVGQELPWNDSPCTVLGDSQYVARVDHINDPPFLIASSRNWLSSAAYDLQNGSGKPLDNACQCLFWGGSAGAKDPQVENAQYYCGYNCSDPAKLIPADPDYSE